MNASFVLVGVCTIYSSELSQSNSMLSLKIMCSHGDRYSILSFMFVSRRSA